MLAALQSAELLHSQYCQALRYITTEAADLHNEGLSCDTRDEVYGTAVLCLIDEAPDTVIYTLSVFTCV